MKLEIRGKEPKEEKCTLWLEQDADGSISLKATMPGSNWNDVVCRMYESGQVHHVRNAYFDIV